MAGGACARHHAGMPRFPSFYLFGALAGCALSAVHAPPPFPLLALVVMVSGFAGLALSLTYLYCFERRALRVKLAGLRRVARRLSGRGARPRVPARHLPGVAPGGWPAR